MKRAWLALVKRLDALAQRERVAVFAAAALAIAASVYVGGIEPALQRIRLVQARGADQERLLAAAQAQQRELTQTLAQDPDRALRERIERIQQEVAAVDARLSGLQRTLVSPERMPGVLRELMSGQRGVQLVSLRNLPPTPLVPDTQHAGRDASEAGAGRNVYRHGVEIVVKGSYLDLLAYMARLERQPWQVFWGKAELSADYPTVMVSLTLYTLSLDKAWLTV
jgi:MSHA biogenesis protein MshJ